MSGTDLAQYNGTPSFPARTDVGTNADPYETVTDGPVVTADSNAAGHSPVNISIKRIKDLLLGLRGAVVGDFAGAAIKTFKSLKVDGTGGAASTAPAGYVEANNVRVPSIFGSFEGGQAFLDTLLTMGFAGLERLLISAPRLTWVATATSGAGANPPQGTSIKNQLRAKNVPKCSAFVNMSAPNTIASFDGYGIQSITINGGNTKLIDVVFKDNFDNTNYVCHQQMVTTIGVATYGVSEVVASRTTAGTQISAINLTAGGADVDFAVTAVSFSLGFFGQQTT